MNASVFGSSVMDSSGPSRSASTRPRCVTGANRRPSEGAQQSASISSVFEPDAANNAARLAASVLLPSPGSSDMTPRQRTGLPRLAFCNDTLMPLMASLNGENGASSASTWPAAASF